MYLSPEVTQQVSCDGCLARCCAGEDCFVMNFTHSGGSTSNNKGYVALTPNYPMAKVVPVDLSSPSVNGVLIAQQGAFMASVGNVEIGVSLDCNLLRCCCAGTGLVRDYYYYLYDTAPLQYYGSTTRWRFRRIGKNHDDEEEMFQFWIATDHIC